MVGGSSIRQRLESIDSRQVNPGLDRIYKLLEALGNPQLDYPTVIIGGTNGKGSVAAMLTAVGRAAGHRVGLYTSPHLTAVEERFQINETLFSTNYSLIYLFSRPLSRGAIAVYPGISCQPNALLN